MGLLLDKGGFNESEVGLGLLCWPNGSSGGPAVRDEAGCSPPVAADLATDST